MESSWTIQVETALSPCWSQNFFPKTIQNKNEENEKGKLSCKLSGALQRGEVMKSIQ